MMRDDNMPRLNLLPPPDGSYHNEAVCHVFFERAVCFVAKDSVYEFETQLMRLSESSLKSCELSSLLR